MDDHAHNPKVFLSYPLRDEPHARAVRRALESAGCDVLTTQHASDGGPRHASEEIRSLMGESDAFVVVTSSEAAHSPWTAFEIGAAMAWRKPVFVIADDVRSLPGYLRKFQVLRLNELPKLTEGVKRTAAPLSTAEQDALLSIYGALSIPADQLVFDPDTSTRLAEEFNRKTRSNHGSDRLLRELLRLRKSGRLPRLRRARTTKAKHSA